MDLIKGQRLELGSVVKESSNIFNSISKLELSKQGSTVITEFADGLKKEKILFEKFSQNETMRLNLNFQKYQSLLISMKAVFNQRKKLGLYLAIVEDELKRKENELKKLPLNNSGMEENVLANTLTDKAKVVNNEYITLKNRYNKIIEKWQLIGKTIKEEISDSEQGILKEFESALSTLIKNHIDYYKNDIEVLQRVK